MTNSHDEAPPITSVAELMAVGAAMADRAVTRYREHAAAIAAAGNAEAAGVLQRLAAERRVCGAELAGQAAAFGWQPAGIAAAPSAVPDEMIDEDPYTVTVYRVLSIAMHDEARAFAFYAYVAAHAADRELQRVAEGLAHEQLGHAAELRRKRRKAWRRMPSGSGSRPPPPQSLAELRTLAGRREGDMAARHGALADAAAALGDLASAEVLRRATGFVRRIDKLPLPVKSAPGFLVNAVLAPYMLAAMHAVDSGISPETVDEAMLAFGMPMGPIELVDTVGLDVGAGVAKELAPFLGIDVPAALGTVEAGKRGKKDGQGLYKWVETEKGSKPQKPELPKDYKAPEDLEDRLILPMLNEAVACLHDGVVADAELLDAGVIFGTGFAPFRGGPIQYIRDTGADALRARLETLQAKYGDRFKPRAGWDSPLLRADAAANA